jgi:hypothetical protein
VLASDWVIKSLIKLLTEEPRPYLSGWRARS